MFKGKKLELITIILPTTNKFSLLFYKNNLKEIITLNNSLKETRKLETLILNLKN